MLPNSDQTKKSFDIKYNNELITDASFKCANDLI
jgi:hypothetical protein